MLDPTAHEEKELESFTTDLGCHGNLTIGLMPSLQQVTCLLQDGVMEKSAVIKVIVISFYNELYYSSVLPYCFYFRQ